MTFVAVVVASLFSSTAYAYPSMDRLQAVRSESFVTAAWEWLVSLFAQAPSWEKDDAGSAMDPNGKK
jgi:hypothetical protein